jgi:hypothetical protein
MPRQDQRPLLELRMLLSLGDKIRTKRAAQNAQTGIARVRRGG